MSEGRSADAARIKRMILSAEDKRLLECISYAEREQKAGRLNAYSAHDWQSVLEQARKHRLLPYLNWQLNQLSRRIAPPEPIGRELHQNALLNTGRNMRLLHELEQILGALQAASVPAIVLKGFHLMTRVYPEIALRSMGDLDLLLHYDDFRAGDKQLLALDYAPSRLAWIESNDRQTHHHLPPYYKDGVLPIEIHWSIAHPESCFSIDVEGIWQRAKAVKIGGAPGLVLGPEDFLLHLSIHLCHYDRFLKGPRALVDVLETLRCYQAELDWQALIERAGEWQVSKHLYLSLYLTKVLFDAPIPKDALRRLLPGDEPVEGWVIDQALENLFYHPGAASSRINTLAREDSPGRSFPPSCAVFSSPRKRFHTNTISNPTPPAFPIST